MDSEDSIFRGLSWLMAVFFVGVIRAVVTISIAQNFAVSILQLRNFVTVGIQSDRPETRNSGVRYNASCLFGD